jgi:rhodanese-related sulfurtransferase
MTTDPYIAFLEAKLATEIGPHEAREELDAGRAILLDVRSAESHAKTTIPGSVHIPRRELANRLREVPTGKTIVTYCSDIGCQASLKAAIELRKNGYNAKHMIGGIKFWQEKGYPTTAGATNTTVISATKRL